MKSPLGLPFRNTIGYLTLVIVSHTTAPSTIAQTPTNSTAPLKMSCREEYPSVDLQARQQGTLGTTSLGTFLVELKSDETTNSSLPLDVRLRFQIKSQTPNNRGKFETYINAQFPQVISFERKGQTTSRTWSIPQAIATNLPVGPQNLEFVVSDLSNRVLRTESFAATVATNRSGRIIIPRSPQVNLGVAYTPNTNTNSNNFGTITYRVSSSVAGRFILNSGLNADSEKRASLSTNISIPRANYTYTYKWTMPEIPKSNNPWTEGKLQSYIQTHLVTDIISTNNTPLKREILPMELVNQAPFDTPSPAFVLTPGIVIKDINNIDLPVQVKQIPLTLAAHKLAKEIENWAGAHTKIYVLEITGDRHFSLGGFGDGWGGYWYVPENEKVSRERLMSWVSSTLLKNYSRWEGPVTVKNDQSSSAVSTLFGDRWAPHFLEGVKKYNDFILSYNGNGKPNDLSNIQSGIEFPWTYINSPPFVEVDRPVSSVTVNVYPENYHPFTAGRVLYFMTQNEPATESNPSPRSAKVYIVDTIYDE
jgi:hypothetical protein